MKQTREQAPKSKNSETNSIVQSGDFWVSVLVLIFVVEFFVSVVALCYGLVMTPPRQEGEPVRIAFPWISWLAAMIIAPALIAGAARMFVGNRDMAQSRREAAWANLLPERALRLYHFVKDAPLFVICLAFLALGATLLTIDSAFSLIRGIALALVPYAPYFIGGATLFAVAMAGIMAWFRYKNNQLLAEYQFRREVLEKTGIVLVDKNDKALLPPNGRTEGYAIGCGGAEKRTESDTPARAARIVALPAADPNSKAHETNNGTAD